MSERGENIDIPDDSLKKEKVKSKNFEEKKYLVSTTDHRLYGTNQKAFTAQEIKKKVDGKERKVFIPEENVLIYRRDSYKTISQGTLVFVTKLK